jgi:hypothetical protein
MDRQGYRTIAAVSRQSEDELQIPKSRIGTRVIAERVYFKGMSTIPHEQVVDFLR